MIAVPTRTESTSAPPDTASQAKDAVTARDVYKRFGTVHALRGLSLSVPAGATYGLLGPNGAGKTTLIRAMVGLIRPDAGAVQVLGVPMPDRAILSQVGYMPQAPALYEDLSVRQNVAFFAAMAGVYAAAAVDAAVALVDLSERAHSPVRTLSGGMRQRTSLACATVHRPRLLILDEPTVGIDPQLRVQFWEHFRRLNAQGVTIVVSSHVMDEAERCDRLGFIQAGRLLAEGDAAELRARAGTDTLEEAFLHFAEV
ncbi:MAG: ABC transporter ATP-binding protein [Anaerolineae bacterium]|nr:ABC transporter ATP-binding protein [Anaerolineae bacterium]